MYEGAQQDFKASIGAMIVPILGDSMLEPYGIE
jgi:hypothetical protein